MSSKYKDLAGVAPYFDDFDAKNNFMRILFNPSRAVQARELTQLQTILHEQSNQTAKHLFKNNSIITGARISTIEKKPAAYLERFQVDNPVASDDSNYNVDPGGVFENENAIAFDETWVGVTFGNGTTAADSDKQITITQYAYETDAGESYPIIYYEFSGKNVVPGEIFTPLGSVTGLPDIAIGWPSKNVGGLQNVVATNDENPFKAMAASCDDGIIYSQGHFLTVVNNEIIASNTPTQGVIEIGYRIVQDVVTESNTEEVPADELDADAGNVLLGQKLRDPASGSRNFNAPGAHRYRVKPHLYAITYDTPADRTAKIAEIEGQTGFADFGEQFEPFMVIVDGRVTKDQSEVQYADILKLLARRTFDESGNYTVEDFDLSLEADPDDPTQFVAELGPGKAYVRGYEIDKKISTRLELERARDTRLKDRTVKTLGSLPYFVLQPAENTESGVEGGVDGGGVNEPWIEIEKQEQVLILNTKIDPASPSFPSEGDPEVIAATRVVSIDRDNDYVRLYLEDVGSGADEIRNAKSIVAVRDSGSTHAWANLAQRRLNNSSNKTTPIFGGDIRPLMVKLSENILKSTSNHRYQVVEKMNVSTTAGSITINLPSGQEFRNRTPFVMIYEEGDPSATIDVSTLTVDSWSSGAITVSGANLSASENYIAYVRVERTGSLANPTTKSLGANKTKNITVNSFGEIDSVETDSVDLDEDLYDVVAVYQTSNLATTNHAGDTEYKLSTDEMLKLVFNDGQSDIQYETGTVSGWRKLWRVNKNDPSTATNYRIEYRSFEHGTPGRVFTVNSYDFADDAQSKIPRYKSDRFGRIDLINCMDFRQTTSNLTGSVTRAPLPSSSLEFQEEYYVGRIDIISLNRNGEFVVTKGVPSNNPTPPTVSEGSMILYKLHIPPYTFSTRDIQIEAHKNTRYTMKDISRLEDRIERLEDSVSLSLLEKNAMDMKITDPETGFDRFKSGIFVDSFEGLSHAETTDPDFYISVDRIERTIHCPVEKNNINMDWSAGVETTKYDNLITLTPDATERIIAQNDTATGTVNLNPYLFYTWVGTVKLDPAVDTWHETRYLPQRNVTVGSWDPPPGFDPNWRIDDIEVNWVGIDPDPNPIPPNPAPPQNSVIEDGLRHVDIAFARSSHRNLMRLLAEGAPQEEIDDAVAEIDTDALLDDSRRRWVLEGAALAARNVSGLEFDVDQEFIDEALRVIGFNGSTRTSTSLGSENVLSSSDSRQIAQQIGAEAFNALTDSRRSELGNQTVQPIGDRLIGNAIANDSEETGPGSNATNENSAIQQQTITEVRDVLTRHTDTSREDRVVDRSEIFWLREQEIEFEGTGFRPGMFVVGYFDNKLVDIVPDSGFEGNDDGETRPKVDSEGNVRGYFKVTARTFTTGTKVFLLIDDEETAQGSAEFTSRGTLTRRQVTVTTTRSVSVRQSYNRTPGTAPVIGRPNIIDLSAAGFRDPIAQSFIVPTEGGCLLSSITAYFSTKAGDFRNNSSLASLGVVGRPADNLSLAEALEEEFPGHPKDPIQYLDDAAGTEYNAPVTLYIVEMRDGTPTSNIVPLSPVTLQANEINSNPYVPEEGETEFRFNDPIYLEQDTEYAFILITTSKEYNAWITELGEQDIFDGTEGVGVAEQPYLGTLFKSQNSSTWTAEQTQTLTFKVNRFNYSDHVGDVTDKTVTFVDSKLKDTLLHDEVTGARVDRDLYSDTFTGNPNDEMTFVSTIFPMFGELALAQTGIAWTHQFSDSAELNMYNNKRNVVFNSSYPTNEFVIDPTNDYTVTAYMSTNNENVSPIIDIEQSRAIAIRNLVKGIETYDGAPLNFIEGAEDDGTGVLIDSEYAYQVSDVFKTTDGTAYIVMVDATTFSTSDESSATFKSELADHVANENVILADDLNLEINQNDIGDAGAYVSKPINLKNPADDIRLIVDTSEPGSSYVKPYYRILNHSPRYVIAREVGDNSEQYVIHESMQGVTERVMYVDTPLGEAAGATLNFYRRDVNENDNFISLNGFDTKQVGSPSVEQKVAYFSGLTDNTAFNTANTSGRTATAFATNSQVLKDAINSGETITVWDDGTTYTRGTIVYHNGAFWHSNGYIGGGSVWGSGTPYSVGDLVTYAGSLFLALNTFGGSATTPIEDTTNWKELSVEYYGVGTVATDPGSAWDRIPTVFFKQDQDDLGQDDTSAWRPMVLKTGRFDKNTHTDNRFYESTWVPKTEPGIEFQAFAIKLDFVTENSRAAVPRAKNLRVIATL